MSVRSIKIYVVLIFCMLPILCMAEESVSNLIQIEQDSLVYELNPKTRTAKLVNGRNSKEKVIIPNTIKRKTKRYKVTEIGDRAFEGNRKLKSITIGDEVNRIGERAFYDCGNLDSIQFTDKTKLDTICENALDECYHLEYMSLPKDFYSIAYNDMDIMQRFWKINHNNLTLWKYPHWVLENGAIEHEEFGDNLIMDLDVYYITGEQNINIYMYLNKDVPTSETDIISDSLHIQVMGDGGSRGGNMGWIVGQLNDSTELIQLTHTFLGRHLGVWWNGCDLEFVAVSPHKIQIITELGYYSEYCEEEDEDTEKEYCFKKEISCSISNRKTNGFYEIDGKWVTEEDDDDGNKHVTSSSSWVLYYDGEKFVKREVETVE